ncbi:potassium channel family protein [Nigerium sp.]|uniref:potassium channel family protein n=1 Tax=Nigerium sp. TaxID=2042655 RepID=UPI003221E721
MAGDRLTAWERRADPLLTAAAVGFLAAYAVPIIWPESPAAIRDTCEVLTWLVWGAFALDYVARLVLSQDRRAYVRRHLLDLAIIALPLLRPLRLLRLVTMLKFIDASATNRFRGRILTYVLGGASLLGFVGALAVLDAERETPGGNIDTFGDALWWAFTTMTTVGYGDRYPVTTMGRFVAVGLMVGGVTILSTVTAMLASWMVERVRADVAADIAEAERRETDEK